MRNIYGCQYLFDIHMNDTAENQRVFYDRLTKAGMNFAAVEISNEYIRLWKETGLPFYIQFAPDKENASADWLKSWNDEIVRAVNAGSFESENIHGTIHLYEKAGFGTLDAAQITGLRGRIGRHISTAVTEYGASEKKIPMTEAVYCTQDEAPPPAYGGLTPKGKTILGVFEAYWRKDREKIYEK